jgi:hypothetical protein
MTVSASKYSRLTAFLKAQTLRECRLSFQQIEDLLGFPLPSSARTHRAWWSNNPANNVMTKAWLAAGWETERVDMGGEVLVFVRRGTAESSARAGVAATSEHSPTGINVFGALKGTIKVTGDILAPIDVTWNAEEGRS